MVNNLSKPYNIKHFEEVTSTNDVASSLGKEGAKHLTVITADKQTEGRGRQGKTWSTIENKSIACSVIVKDAGDEMLPLVAAVAICKALRNFTPQASIKWPNDILIDTKKVCGLLVEKVTDETPFYILGFGVNVLEHDGLMNTATSLEFSMNSSGELSVEKVLHTILLELVKTLKTYKEEGWEYLCMQYQNMCGTFHKEIEWKPSEDAEPIVGIAVAMNENGALLLQKENGEVIAIHSGEIIAQGKEL